MQITQIELAVGEHTLGSAAALARYLGVDRSQVSRVQRAQQQLGEEPAWRLTALETAYAALRHVLDPEVIPAWLAGANAHLQGRRPIDLLQGGRLAEVMQAIEAERTGAYA